MTVQNLIFVDRRVTEYEALVAGHGTDTLWFHLELDRDGIEQMLGAVGGFANLSSIQVISHGRPGMLLLGGTLLNNESLPTYAEALSEIGATLDASGDLLLYGCEVASGVEGQAFMEQLARITGADVAASSDFTGADDLGGNWTLEATVGTVESQAIAPKGFTGLLANTAPILTPAGPTLAAITEDDIANPGQTVASLLGNSLADIDFGAQKGIALMATSGQYGAWQFSLNAGVAWTNVGAVSIASSLLLRESDFLRWQPDGINAPKPTLTYRGWDQTTGTAGTKVDTSTIGGTSAFSASIDSATLEVVSVNDVPSIAIAMGEVITTTFGTSSSFGHSVTLQPDGKILVAGSVGISTGNTDFALVRYNANGSLDTTFDGDGKVTTAIGTGLDEGRSVTLQPDGKILVSGYSFNGINADLALVRYNANGSLDTTFDADGKLTTEIQGFDYGQSVTLQPDGKILVAGRRSDGGMVTEFAVVRFNSNGSLDTTFDGDGKLTTTIGTKRADGANSVTLQSDGKILVGGYSHNGINADLALVRYNANGSLDTTFDGDGKVTTAIGTSWDEGRGITLQPDGKILVAGYSRNDSSNDDFALVRYNADGSLDTTFDGDGKVTTAIGTSTDQARSVALQPDGKILVAGYSYNGINDDFALVRYNADGSLDTTFDGDGKLTTGVGSGNEQAYSVTLRPDGKFLVAGSSSGNFALVRYNADGSLINHSVIEQDPVLLNSVRLDDPDLNAFGNEGGSSISLSRRGGPSEEDTFLISGGFSALTEDSLLVTGGSLPVGVVTQNSGGILKVTFNKHATQEIVNSFIQSLRYKNNSDDPPEFVEIDWSYNDGTAGPNGAGTITKVLVINITPVNDAPTASTRHFTGQKNTDYTISTADFGVFDAEDGSNLTAVRIEKLPTEGRLYFMGGWLTSVGFVITASDIENGYLSYRTGVVDDSFTFRVMDSDGLYDTSPEALIYRINSTPTGAVNIAVNNGHTTATLTEGDLVTATNSLSDADGLTSITYIWAADGVTVGTGTAYTLTQAEVGKRMSVTASYVDGGNTAEAVASLPTGVVGAAPSDQRLTGIAYHWKSHALLDSVTIKAVNQDAVTPSPSQVVDLRAASLDTATGRLTVEVWAELGGMGDAFDFTAMGPAGSTLSFSSVLGTDWTALANTTQSGKLTLGAYLSNTSSTGLAAPTRVGSLEVQLPAIAGDVEIHFSEVRVGSALVPDLVLGVTAATTDTIGTFAFATLPKGAYSLHPTRPTGDGANGVTSADALAALRLAVGINPNPDPDGDGPLQPLKVSPYQIMAADVNQDGLVTSSDALAILRMAIKLPSALPQEWFFVEENRDLWDESTGLSALTRTNATWDRSLFASAPGEANLVGVLKGDVNGSWTAPAYAQDLDLLAPDHLADLAQRINTALDQFGVYSGA